MSLCSNILVKQLRRAALRLWTIMTAASALTNIMKAFSVLKRIQWRPRGKLSKGERLVCRCAPSPTFWELRHFSKITNGERQRYTALEATRAHGSKAHWRLANLCKWKREYKIWKMIGHLPSIFIVITSLKIVKLICDRFRVSQWHKMATKETCLWATQMPATNSTKPKVPLDSLTFEFRQQERNSFKAGLSCLPFPIHEKTVHNKMVTFQWLLLVMLFRHTFSCWSSQRR